MNGYNFIQLTGKKTYYQLFDMDGKAYTSMWIRVKTADEANVLVVIDLNAKNISSPKCLELQRALSGDAPVFLSVGGELRLDKKGSARVKANLDTVNISLTDLTPKFTGILAGKLTYDHNSLSMTIKNTYRNPKENTWQDREFVIYLPDPSSVQYQSLNRNCMTNITKANNVCVQYTTFTEDKHTYLLASEITLLN